MLNVLHGSARAIGTVKVPSKPDPVDRVRVPMSGEKAIHVTGRGPLSPTARRWAILQDDTSLPKYYVLYPSCLGGLTLTCNSRPIGLAPFELLLARWALAMWLLRRGMDVFESRDATLALLGAGLLLLSGLVGTFLRWQRLRHVPGPFLNSLTVWPLLKRTVRGDLHQYMKDLSDEYGTFPARRRGILTTRSLYSRTHRAPRADRPGRSHVHRRCHFPPRRFRTRRVPEE